MRLLLITYLFGKRLPDGQYAETIRAAVQRYSEALHRHDPEGMRAVWDSLMQIRPQDPRYWGLHQRLTEAMRWESESIECYNRIADRKTLETINFFSGSRLLSKASKCHEWAERDWARVQEQYEKLDLVMAEWLQGVDVLRQPELRFPGLPTQEYAGVFIDLFERGAKAVGAQQSDSVRDVLSELRQVLPRDRDYLPFHRAYVKVLEAEELRLRGKLTRQDWIDSCWSDFYSELEGLEGTPLLRLWDEDQMDLIESGVLYEIKEEELEVLEADEEEQDEA